MKHLKPVFQKIYADVLYRKLFCLIVFKKETELNDFFKRHQDKLEQLLTHRFTINEGSATTDNILHLAIKSYKPFPTFCDKPSFNILKILLDQLETISQSHETNYLSDLLNEKQEELDIAMLAKNRELPNDAIELIDNYIHKARTIFESQPSQEILNPPTVSL